MIVWRKRRDMNTAEAQRHLAAAQQARQRGDVTGATRLFENALAADPANPHAHNALGMIALDANDPAAAETRFRAAAAADPTEPALWLNVAKAQRLRGDGDGELASLDAALAIDQRHFMALLRKAELLERMERRGAAAQSWGGVVLLAEQAGELPRGIADAVAHGRGYVAAHAQALGAAMADGLEQARAALDARELRRFDACVETMLGKRRVYRNECHGVYFPFLPPDEFFDRTHFAWMPAIEAQTGAIRDEFRALIAGEGAPLRPYVAQASGTPANKWTPLDNSLAWGAMFLWEYGVRDDALCARCPVTAAALDAVPRADIPGRGPTAFFSILEPKTTIPPHTGVTNVRAIVHLPLIVPEGCTFRVGGETRSWREGEAFAFDDTIEHEAVNDSDQRRAVLIFDTWNPHLSEAECTLIRTMFAVGDASSLAPDERGAGL